MATAFEADLEAIVRELEADVSPEQKRRAFLDQEEKSLAKILGIAADQVPVTRWTKEAWSARKRINLTRSELRRAARTAVSLEWSRRHLPEHSPWKKFPFSLIKDDSEELNPISESPRLSRRLQTLRGWSHE
ncbi:hypothetical protein, partial [Arenimonas sp.]|uniref:hypothetical protein n=1 Tax=Arenimonas sp. TaxID=1872635 RepID=UPI0035B1AE35